MLLVEHHADLIFDICDRVTVLNLGKVLAAGTPAEIRSHREVVSAYLGAVSRCSRSAACRPATARSACCNGIDLTVGAGEIVALLGPNGAGKTHAAAGHLRPAAAHRQDHASPARTWQAPARARR